MFIDEKTWSSFILRLRKKFSMFDLGFNPMSTYY